MNSIASVVDNQKCTLFVLSLERAHLFHKTVLRIVIGNLEDFRRKVELSLPLFFEVMEIYISRRGDIGVGPGQEKDVNACIWNLGLWKSGVAGLCKIALECTPARATESQILRVREGS